MEIKNTYGINEIKIFPMAKCYCPIGKDWYTNNFEVTMIPNSLIPDYCEVDEFIQQQIDNEKLIIEEAVNKLFTQLSNYGPKELIVSSQVYDAVHAPVVVTKTYKEAN